MVSRFFYALPCYIEALPFHMPTHACHASITKYCRDHDIRPEECVAEMRRVVYEESDLTVSAGIAPNKVGIAYVCASFPL